MAEMCEMADDEQVRAPSAPAAEDRGGLGWGALGFFVPLAGLILFVVWRDSRPRTARAAGKGALACVVVGLVMGVASVVLTVAVASSLSL